MTVAIASRCLGGSLVVADKNIIITDGSKLTGRKIYSRDFPKGSVVLASSALDGTASEYLATEILDDLEERECLTPKLIVRAACEKMQDWYQSYPQGSVPELTYLMVASSSGEQEIYLLELPRTFVTKEFYSIGSGARTAQPLLEMLTPNMCSRQAASLLYLMYVARHAEQETAFVGGGFDAVYVPTAGSQIWIDPRDVVIAHDSLWEIDCCLSMLLPFVMSLGSKKEIDEGSESLRDYLAAIAMDLSERKLFPSLVEKLSSGKEGNKT